MSNTSKKTRAIYPAGMVVSAFLTLNVAAAAPPTVPPRSTSGQLLQNNPMLNNSLLPHSGRVDDITLPEKKKKEDDQNAPKLHVSQIRVTHLPDIATKDVTALTDTFRNKEMTLNGLNNVAVSITAILQAKGERLSYAYIPQQDVNKGVVTIDVVNGHIESINIIHNRSLLSNGALEKYLANMNRGQRKINALEQSMTNISDLPGVGNVSGVLSRGDEPGGSKLRLELTPSPRVSGVLVFDNMGSLTSGRDRLGLQMKVNSPFGFGDQLQALAYYAPDFLQTTNDSEHGNTLIGRLAYDVPLSISGARLGAAVSRVSYKLGGPALHGLGDGYADIASLYSNVPLLNQQDKHLTLAANVDFKRMQDKFWGMNNKRHAPVLGLQLSGDYQGALWGLPHVIQYQLGGNAGKLSNLDDWNGNETRGRYYTAVESFIYQQALYPGISTGINISGQQASKNLDGAEKMSLGGPYAVRAYSNSVASVDSGWVVSPSVNFNLPGLSDATLQFFYDYAHGKIQKFAKTSQTIEMKGYGIGLSWNMTSQTFLNTSYAWRQGHDALLGPQNKATGWVTGGLRF